MGTTAASANSFFLILVVCLFTIIVDSQIQSPPPPFPPPPRQNNPPPSPISKTKRPPPPPGLRPRKKARPHPPPPRLPQEHGMNPGKKLGVLFFCVALTLQIAVVVYLLYKRREYVERDELQLQLQEKLNEQQPIRSVCIYSTAMKWSNCSAKSLPGIIFCSLRLDDRTEVCCVSFLWVFIGILQTTSCVLDSFRSVMKLYISSCCHILWTNSLFKWIDR